MTDYGAEYTDKELEKMEKKIKQIYSEAEKDIQKKMNEFNQAFKAKEAVHLQELKDGKITQADFDAWKRGQVFQGQQWQSKKDQISGILYNANKEAANIINGGTVDTFAENANWSHYEMEHTQGVNFGFGLYDAHTVTNLVKNDPQVLPKWKVNEKKDYEWNGKKVDNAITQGIIQGERLDQIAERISTALSANNRNTMLTFARTAMTGAQNAGRFQGLMDAKELDIDVVKVWMATLDDHTRASHQEIDGEEQKVGDKWHPFKFSNGCRYPGDPMGPPHEVYNCRCTLVSDIKDYPSKFKRYDNINGVPVDQMTYKEWKEAKKQNTATDNLNSVNNNDDILNLARSIIKSTGVNYSGNISMHSTLNNGECVVSQSPNISKTCIYTEYNLNPNDTRPTEYRVKTAYHEAFHLSLNGKPWDAINKNWKIDNDWCNIEETLTECAAHYKMKDTYGIYNLLPSYPHKLVWNLPRLKMLDEYSECSTIQDFGRIAWKNRVTSYDGKSGIWGSISRRVKKQKVGSEYFVQYHGYIEEHKDALIDKLVEGGVLPSNLKPDALNDLDTALNLVDRAGVMPGYDSGSGVIYYNVMAQVMQEVGVK